MKLDKFLFRMEVRFREVCSYGPGNAMRIRARASARCFIYVLVTIFVAMRGCHREFCFAKMSKVRGGKRKMDRSFGEFLRRIFYEIREDCMDSYRKMK